MNSIENSIYIFMLFLLMFGFSIGLTVMDEFYNKTVDVLDNNDIVIPEGMDNYENMNVTIKYAMEFLLVLSVVILFVSSAIESKNLTGYIVGFLSSLIVTSILIFLTSQLYSSFTLLGSSYIDFTIIPTWFLENIVTLFFLNVLAGLCSFIFVFVRGGYSGNVGNSTEAVMGGLSNEN